MSSSAINSQIWNAKAANVQNADGSPIYSAGIWTFKSSTNVTTFSVSDGGAVTAATNTSHNFGNSTTGTNTTVYIRGATTGFAAMGTLNASGKVYAWRTLADGTLSIDEDGAPYTCAKVSAGAWTFPVSVNVTGTADVSGTTAALRTDGGCYVAKIMSAGTVTDRTPFPKDKATAFDAVESMCRLPDGEYQEDNKEHQLDHSKLHPYLQSGDYRDMSATVSCLAVVCQELSALVTAQQAQIDALRLLIQGA